MSTVLAPSPGGKKNAALAIIVGGLVAGILDLTQASVLFGWKVPLVIAGGLLGGRAFNGGAGTFILGILLHFFIAFTVTTIYLPRQPPADFHARPPAGMRPFLRHGG